MIPLPYMASPKKGLDGMYRYKKCGMLMTEKRFYCEQCAPEKTATVRENEMWLVLVVVIGAIVALGLHLMRLM